MPISKSDLKTYLTSVEPGVEQTIYSQSLGGYPGVVLTDLTKSLLNPETLLTADTGTYQEQFTVSDYTLVSSKTYLHANGEIVKPDSITAATIPLGTRGVNEVQKMHIIGDVVHGIKETDTLFNENFNTSFQQYRCIAVRNNSAVETAFDVKVYFKQKSRNAGSKVRMAIEVPLNDRRIGTVTANSSNKITFVDNSLIGVVADNFCLAANIRFTGGLNINQQRLVSSFDSTTGMFVVDSSLPFAPVVGDLYEIQPGPAQRVSSGIVSPTIGSGRVSSWYCPDKNNAISIDVSGLRENDKDMLPNDVFYLWFERALDRDSLSFDLNDVIFSVLYSEV